MHCQAPQDRSPIASVILRASQIDPSAAKHHGTFEIHRYKAFARTNEEGFVDKAHTTLANRAESPEFATMIDGAKAQRVLAELPLEHHWSERQWRRLRRPRQPRESAQQASRRHHAQGRSGASATSLGEAVQQAHL